MPLQGDKMDRRDRLIAYIAIIFCVVNVINYGMMLIDLEFWNQGHTICYQNHDKAYYGKAFSIPDSMYAEMRRTTWGWALHYLMTLFAVGAILIVCWRYCKPRELWE